MNISQETDGSATTFRLDGRLDSSSTSGLDQQLPARVHEGGLIIVDLGNVSFVSSAGLRVFLKAAKAAKVSKARLVLAGMSPDVREVFDISGFSVLFEIVASTADV